MKRVHNLELDICLLLFWVFPGMAYTFELICSYVHVGNCFICIPYMFSFFPFRYREPSQMWSPCSRSVMRGERRWKN